MNNKKIWTAPAITAVEQMSAAQVAGYPMGVPKTTPLQTEGIYQGGQALVGLATFFVG